MKKRINFNEKIRNYVRELFEVLNNVPYPNFNFEELDAMIIHNKLYEKSDVDEYNILRNMIYMEGYSCLYMILNDKKKQKIITKDESFCFDVLKNVKSQDQLQKMFFSNTFILNDAILAIYSFSKKNNIEKKCIINELSQTEKKNINQINSLFFQDISEFDGYIDINFLNSNIEKMINDPKFMIDIGRYYKRLIKMENPIIYNIMKKYIYTDLKMCSYALSNVFVEDYLKDIDKFENVKERMNQLKLKSIGEYIKELRIYQIIDIIDSNIEYCTLEENEKDKVNLFFDDEKKNDAKIKLELGRNIYD